MGFRTMHPFGPSNKTTQSQPSLWKPGLCVIYCSIFRDQGGHLYICKGCNVINVRDLDMLYILSNHIQSIHFLSINLFLCSWEWNRIRVTTLLTTLLTTRNRSNATCGTVESTPPWRLIGPGPLVSAADLALRGARFRAYGWVAIWLDIVGYLGSWILIGVMMWDAKSTSWLWLTVRHG